MPARSLRITFSAISACWLRWVRSSLSSSRLSVFSLELWQVTQYLSSVERGAAASGGWDWIKGARHNSTTETRRHGEEPKSEMAEGTEEVFSLGCFVFTGSSLVVDVVENGLANVLLQFPVGGERKGARKVIGPGEGFGIFDGDIDFEMAEIGAVVALGEVHVFAVRPTGGIEPGFVVETDGIDHEGIAIPLADGLAGVAFRLDV